MKKICIISSMYYQDIMEMLFDGADEEVEKHGLNNIVCPIGGEFLEVVSPYTIDTTAGRFIDKKKGPAGYMTIFQCEDSIERKNYIESKGIRVLNAFEPKGNFINNQFHSIFNLNPTINKRKYNSINTIG